MKYRNDLTAEYVREILDYNPKTGEFFWKVNKQGRYAKKGNKAGYTDISKGYIRIEINGVGYKAHRLAWLYMTGEWPKKDIDHENRIKTDNRWKNIRLANNTQNNANRECRSNNTSGYKGVSWNKQYKKWAAIITINNKLIYLGSFNTKEEAALAYNEAALKYFGEYACLNEIS